MAGLCNFTLISLSLSPSFPDLFIAQAGLELIT